MADLSQLDAINRNEYFPRLEAETAVAHYVLGACTDISLRNRIIEQYAIPLVNRVIKSLDLYNPAGSWEEFLAELNNAALVAIERSMYKFKAYPICRYCYENNLIVTRLADDLIPPSEIRSKKCKVCHLPLDVAYRGKAKLFSFWTNVAVQQARAHIKQMRKDPAVLNRYRTYKIASLKGRHVTDIGDLLTKMEQLWPDNEIFQRIIAVLRNGNASHMAVHDQSQFITRMKNKAQCDPEDVVEFMEKVQENFELKELGEELDDVKW